jgi:stalled ribosome rescue protein Dom34
VAVTLCVPPRPGELCAPVRFLLRQDSVVMELTARHRITSVEWDEREHAVVMVVEITDPQTARPVDVRIDVIDGDASHADARVRTIGRIVRGGKEFEVVGTYLGVVADEN